MTVESEQSGREAIAGHFRSRIEAVMASWRAISAADPVLRTGAALPRSQLEDHLPRWLEAFADLLAAAPGTEAGRAEAGETENAAAHGLQRWQQGYDLHEVTREWGCLHRALVLELEACAAVHPEAASALPEARLKLAEEISEATSSSAQQYFRLERMEATGNVRDLERALADIRALENARAELWQQAAHDLRGNLGVVANVAEGLGFSELPAQRRQDFLGLLRNNVLALRHLLDDVTGLARLQAGQEVRRVAEFDAGDMLERLCNDVRPLADGKGLSLKTVGPQTLTVVGDAVKVRRVVLNLLLNALKYTRAGGVTVSWGVMAAADGERWSIAVEDTGPGFHAGPGAPMIDALSEATVLAANVDAQAATAATPGSAPTAEAQAEPIPPDARPVAQAQGEGLGLAIVKRLCELLDASVEVQSTPSQGTTFRILLPIRYAGSEPA